MSFFPRINPNTIPSSIDPKNQLNVLRERILQTFLLIILPLGLIAYIINIGIQLGRGNYVLVVIYSLVFAWLIGIAFSRKLTFSLRSSSFLLTILILGITELLASGLSGDGRIFLLAFVVVSSILYEPRFGWINLLVSILSIVVVGSLMATGVVAPPPIEIQANSANLTDWVSSTIIFILLSSAVTISIIAIVKGLSGRIAEQSDITKALSREQESSESRVQERTIAIEKRLAQMDAASKVARDILSMSNAHQIFDEAVNLIKERFGFYHAGLFLMDQSGEFAVLHAATGEAGKLMLTNQHRLRVGEEGIVGYVVSKAKPRVSQLIDEDTVHFRNPLLPQTRSEMAVPLILREKVIGALDVQSTQSTAFTADDVSIMQALADQLVLAYDKAQLMGEMKSRVDELTNTQQRFTRQSWHEHLRGSGKRYSYRYSPDSDFQVADVPNPEAQKALELAQPIIMNLDGVTGANNQAIAIPIRLRNQTLGVINIRYTSGGSSQDQYEIANAIADRLSVALESARLMEEIQSRAERERLIGEISAKFRTSTNLEGTMRTAAEEIGQKLGVSSVTVQLRPTPAPSLERDLEAE